jgi:hypothetical protein
MARILFWNIQTFGINKINDPSRKRPAGYGGLTCAQAAQMRETVLARVFMAAVPDIIVIVEVASGNTWPSDLASTTGGMAGANYILGELRQGNPNRNWRLVPPLRIGRTPGSKPETVAILYSGTSSDGQTRRYFTGPNWWQGQYQGTSFEPNAGIANNYPNGGVGLPDINAMVVPPGSNARQIPNGALHNAGRYENQVAARTAFQILDEPGEYLDFGVYRPPYMATFTETDAHDNVQRNLTVFGVHSPAVAGDAGVFITYLSQAEDVAGPLGANETRVIGGDFNLNMLAADGSNSGVYDNLPTYAPLLSSPGAPPAANLERYKGYFATHMKPASATATSRFLWSDTPNDSPYPGYGYIGSHFVNNFYSIDNILVRPHQGAPYNYETTIMNYIAGSPFANPPNNAPPGTINMLSGFYNALIPWPPQPDAPQTIFPGTRNNLISWPNYGYLYGTSDHFAVYATI